MTTYQPWWLEGITQGLVDYVTGGRLRMTTQPTAPTATTIIHVTAGRDAAFVQRYFAKPTDEKRCMHGLTMYQNCDACRKITGRRFPDAAQVAGLCDDGSCVDEGVEYVY